jgi:hypothetical protein
MAFIVISVKNCEDTEGIKLDVLSKEMVEGVIVSKDDDQKPEPKTDQENDQKDDQKTSKKRKLKKTEIGDEKTEDEFKYTHWDPGLNVRLTLHSVKFINPAGVASAVDNDECWIKPSEEKPYIAIAMSMGDTERKENLFIAEDVSSLLRRSYILG